jgi:hypothetical protein
LTEPIPSPQVDRHRWYRIALALIFIVFCLELGMFLAVFPWTDFWDRSFFSALDPAWRPYWSNAYLRGAVTGLGVVDVYISLVEIFRLRRFARHS